MNGFNFLLDENVDPDLRSAAHQQVPAMTIWIVGDPGAPEMGVLDPAILEWCEEHQFILVTNNRSTMPIHLRDHIGLGRNVPGIIMLNAGISMGDTVDDLILIWEAGEVDEFANQIVYLPL